MAAVTPDGSAPEAGLVAAAGADDALGVGAGAGVVLVDELLDPPHAAMATVATARTGRTREPLVIRWMAEGMDGLRPLNVRTASSAVHARVILVTTSVPGRWDSHPHLGVVLLTVPAFGPWDDRAATSCSSRLLGGSLSYGTRRRAAMAHTRRRCDQKTKRPTRVVCAGGASKTFSTRRSDLLCRSLRSSTCGNVDCA
jgi:hypothetical protein